MSTDLVNNSENPQISRILAIDFGMAKIGLALADTETKIAFGYGTLDNNSEVLEKISKIIEKEAVEKIIIGKIGNWKQDEKNAKQIEKFVESLKAKIKIPIEFFEEMFSTKMAESNLKDAGKKNIKSLDNEESARIILENWLECANI